MQQAGTANWLPANATAAAGGHTEAPPHQRQHWKEAEVNGAQGEHPEVAIAASSESGLHCSCVERVHQGIEDQRCAGNGRCRDGSGDSCGNKGKVTGRQSTLHAVRPPRSRQRRPHNCMLILAQSERQLGLRHAAPLPVYK